MFRPIASTLTAVACCVLTMAAQAPAPAPPAPQVTFRTGIDVVQFDVTVLDKNGHPIRGLTAADFTVSEAGRARPIVAFTPVEIPAPAPTSAGWMRDVAPDVVV